MAKEYSESELKNVKYIKTLLKVDQDSSMDLRLQKAILFKSNIVSIYGIDNFLELIAYRVKDSSYVDFASKSAALTATSVINPKFLLRVDDKECLEVEEYRNFAILHGLDETSTSKWVNKNDNSILEKNRNSILAFKYNVIRNEIIEKSIDDLLGKILPALNNAKNEMKDNGSFELDELKTSIDCMFGFSMDSRPFRTTEEIPCTLRLMV